MAVCKNCGFSGEGKYCSNCGQSYEVKRITIHSIIHEVTHLFTHIEHGFLYTLKQLATRPGAMQREYIEGHREKHQKPFSMFFLCATVAGLGIYFITQPATKEEMNAFEEARLHFYRHYYVITQAILLPLYALVSWLLFRSKKFNYAEALVVLVYRLSMMLLLVIFVNLLNLVPGDFETAYVELPLLAIYVAWTNLAYFKEQPGWLVVVKSVVSLVVCWFISYFITELVITKVLLK